MGLKFQTGEAYYMKMSVGQKSKYLAVTNPDLRFLIGYANPHFASKDSELNFYTVQLNLFDLGEELSLQRLLDKMIFDGTKFPNKV